MRGEGGGAGLGRTLGADCLTQAHGHPLGFGVSNRQTTAAHQELERVTKGCDSDDLDASPWDQAELHQAATKGAFPRDVGDRHDLSDLGLRKVHRRGRDYSS